MSNWKRFRNRDCLVCAGERSDCRQSPDTGIIHCRGQVFPPNFRFLGEDSLGFSMFKEADENEANPEEWKLKLEERQRQNEAKEARRRARCLSEADRHREFLSILESLPLSRHHHQTIENDRGLTPEQVKTGLFRSVVPGQRLSREYNRRLPGIRRDGRSLIIGGNGIIAPVLSADGLITALVTRPDKPIGKNKYPWVSSDSAYRLPNNEPPLDHRNGGDRPWVAFVEGAGSFKPCITANRLGCAVVGASGGNFGSSPEQVKAALSSGKTPVLVPDTGAIHNPNVMGQYRRLAKLVPGLMVFWYGQIQPKSEGGRDVDEVDAATLDQAQLITFAEFEAMAPDEGKGKGKGDRPSAPTPIHGLRRRPDLHIGDREFTEAVDQIPSVGAVGMVGGTGCGKSKATNELLKKSNTPWISYTTLRSLAKDQENTFGGAVIRDGDRAGKQLLKDGQPVNGGIACIESLLATRWLPAKRLVVDELPAILACLFTSDLTNKRGERGLAISEFSKVVKEAEQVIIASADLKDYHFEWLEETRGEKVFIVQSDRKPLPYLCYRHKGTKAQYIGDFLKKAKGLLPGKIAFFHADQKKTADKVAGLLEANGVKVLLITRDTSGGALESEFLASKGLSLPSLLMAGYGAVVTSPSVKEGFSIEHNTNLIDSIWGLGEGGSITAAAIAQTLDRVRDHKIDRHLWVAERGRAYSKLSREESIPAFMREFRKASTDTLKLARRALLTETDIEAGKIDWDCADIRLLAAIETERNRDMSALRARVEAILLSRGKTIVDWDPIVSVKEARAVSKQMREIRSQQEVEQAIATEKEETPTEEQARLLEKEENPTPSQVLQLKKFYLQEFYRLEEVTADDVLWDKGGEKQKAIRRLEMVLNPALAIARSAKSIERNTDTPQDWNDAVLQAEAFEASGAAAFIRDIVDGKVTGLPPDRVKPIADWAWENQDTFKQRLGFNLKGKIRKGATPPVSTVPRPILKRPKETEAQPREAKPLVENTLKAVPTPPEPNGKKSKSLEVSDNQIVFHLLDLVGITRTCTKTRADGQHVRNYSVDQSNLEKLKTIMERRSQICGTPSQHLSIGGGAALPEFADLPKSDALDLTESWLAATTHEEKYALLDVAIELRGAIAA